jgi:hypothetical protein
VFHCEFLFESFRDQPDGASRMRTATDVNH